MYHCTIHLLFYWFGLVCFANKNKNCQLSANSKPVKQEVNSTVILSPLVFPALANGKQSTVNKSLDGSMYPGQKLTHSALGKKKSLFLKTQQLMLGTGTAIWCLTEPH
jgi:hypothetical protein